MTRDAHITLPRLYVSRENISRGDLHDLSEGQNHYLRNVMRLKPGDRLRCFNGYNGEWLTEIKELSKKNAVVSFDEKIRNQLPSPDLWVLASPVKKEAFDLMAEKASELGATQFIPIECDRTVISRINRERLQSIAIEAAEQCERLDVMEIAGLIDLETLFDSWYSGRRLLFCIERGHPPAIAKVLLRIARNQPIAVLIGPEGGFTQKEIDYVIKQKFTTPVSLGPRILKSETAMIAALACAQAIYFTEGTSPD